MSNELIDFFIEVMAIVRLVVSLFSCHYGMRICYGQVIPEMKSTGKKLEF